MLVSWDHHPIGLGLNRAFEPATSPIGFSMVLSMVKSRFQPIAGASPQQALLGMMVLVVHSPNLGRWGKMAIFSHGEKMGKLWCTIDVGGFPDGSPPKKNKNQTTGFVGIARGPKRIKPLCLDLEIPWAFIMLSKWSTEKIEPLHVRNVLRSLIWCKPMCRGKYPQVQPDYIHRLNIKLLAMLWCPVFVFSAAVAPKPFSLHQCIVIARRLINSTTRKHWATWGSFG